MASNIMKEAISLHKTYFTNKQFLGSCFVAALLLSASLVVNFYAAFYATEHASNSVTDIILSNIPPYDVDGIFIFGPIVFWIVVGLIVLYRPKRIPYVLKSIALFVLIRSIFISVTHIGPFPNGIPINYSIDIVGIFTSGGDLFFSAHTGLPFLMALIFWDTPSLRYLFSATAVFFGIIVLLAHLHYTIDVLAAFFITYTISHIAERAFKRDRQMFLNGL
jgi:hypothetical protein